MIINVTDVFRLNKTCNKTSNTSFNQLNIAPLISQNCILKKKYYVILRCSKIQT